MKLFTSFLVCIFSIIFLSLSAQKIPNKQLAKKSFKISLKKVDKKEARRFDFVESKSMQSKEEEYEEQEHQNENNEYAHAHSSWYYEMLKKKPNLNKAEFAFNQYFNKHSKEDSKLKDRFERWYKQACLYKDKNGFGMPFPISKRTASAFTSITSVNGTYGSWAMIGPTNMQRVQPCNNNNLVTGGFCDRVFVNPYNTQNLYAGFSYGGLWVSTNQGSSWQLTDGGFANGTNTYANRDYYYGEIEAHKLNSALVLAATEAGLLKSVNSGVNWTLCPLLNRTASPTNRPYYVTMATDNQSVMLSTFGKQVFRSADAGTTWNMVFDNSAGGSNHRFTNQYTINTPFGLNERNYNFFGLEADFNDPNHFYLGVWNSSNQACIYESNDKGLTFTLLKNLNTTLTTTWGATTSLCLKTIPSSATKFFVYEQFVASGKPYYKFSNTGSLLSSTAINAYPEAFDIDWNNENTLYQGEYSPSTIKKSTDAGNSFAIPYSTASGNCNYLHPDIRGISAVGNVVLIGNDGGIGLSTDGAANLKGTGFEINSMDMWGFASSPKTDICLTGLDHNQTFVRSYAADGGWKSIKGADAGVCSINPFDDHWLYYDWAYGVNKGYLNPNGTVTESTVSTLPDLGSLQFHPNLMFNIFGIQKSNNNILVKSSDNMVSATIFKDFGSKVNALRIARTDPKTMYVLLNQTTIQKTVDSGITWVNITPTSTASNGQTNITAIEVGKTPGELWAAYGNAQNSAKVLYSIDGGAVWTNITTVNLPAVAVNDIAYQRGTNGGVYIITITSNGTIIWYKNNVIAQWQQVGTTLPLIGYLTNKLFVVPAANKIRFGSSRGAWENDLYEPSQSIEAGFAVGKTTTDCFLDSIQYFDGSGYGIAPVSFAWQFPGGSPATSTLMNPKVSYSAPGFYNATLTVTNQYGSSIKTVNNIVQYTVSNCCTTPTSPWQLTNVGTVSTPATVCYTPVDKNYKFTTTGNTITDPNDAFTFVNQSLTGDGQIIARIKDISGSYNTSSGIMMRNTLAANSGYVYLNALDTRGVFDLYRTSTGGGTGYHAVTTYPFPMWLRLQRKSNTITEAYSADGITWTDYYNHIVSFNTTIYVGLAVTAANSNIDNVTVGPLPLVVCNGGSANGCASLDTIAGKALNFYDYSYFNIPVTATTPTNTVTITGWLKPKGNAGGEQSSIMAWDDGYLYMGQTNTDNQLEYVWNSGDASTSWNSGLLIPADKWSFIALVVRPDSATLYLNNKKSTHIIPHAMSTIQNTLIGNSNPGAGYFLGQMDELSVFKRALTTNEIDSMRHLTRENQANPLAVSYDPSLISYFQFNDSSSNKSYNLIGSDIFDIGGGANKIKSTAPIGAGISSKAFITTSGTYNFAGPEVTVNFPSGATVPNGSVWITRLNTLPFNTDTANYPQKKYYIVNNYGTNSTITAPNLLTFKNVLLSTPTYISNRKLLLIKRGDNSDALADWTANLDSVNLIANGTNAIDVSFTKLQITDFSQFFIKAGTPFVPVPVNFVYFNTSLISENNGLIFWKIEVQSDFKEELEYSIDNITFTTLLNTQLNAGLRFYSYDHLNLIAGTHYYRLKITESTSKVSYSAIKTVTVLPKDKSLKLFPNPIKNGALYIKNPEGKKGEISIYNAAGNLVFQSNVTGDVLQKINVSNLASAVYIVSYTIDTKKQSMLIKIK